MRCGRKSCKAALVPALLVVAAGCGESERQPAPREVAGPAQRVAEVVDRLDAAVRGRDFETICQDLLTASARERSGGARCAATLAETARGVRDPRIRLLSVELTGTRARARLRSRAQGQAVVEETLLLERLGRGYRIAALDG